MEKIITFRRVKGSREEIYYNYYRPISF